MEKGKETTPSIESIRKSEDIEQDAHNVVILNKDYAEVFKAREGYESSQRMAVNTVKQSVFWETSGEYKPTPEDNDKTNEGKNKTSRRKNYTSSWIAFTQTKSDTKDKLQ